MVKILSHRANINGSDKERENRAIFCAECLKLGFGLELDVRNYMNSLYAKHDPVLSQDEQSWLELVSVISSYPNLPIAINIKDTGAESSIISSISDLNKNNVFLFDLELVVGIEKYTCLSSLYHELDPMIDIAIRVSDRSETIERAVRSQNKVVWLDEFDSFWVSHDIIRALNGVGKTVYAVAPDLHKHSLDVSMFRCQQFSDWGVAGICTDYPIILKGILEGLS